MSVLKNVIISDLNVYTDTSSVCNSGLDTDVPGAGVVGVAVADMTSILI